MEESELNLLVSDILNENRYSHCRLCLKNIKDHYVRFYDSVSLDSESRIFQELSTVLSKLLGAEICDEVVGVDAVCMSCVDKALDSLKFLQTCEKSTEVLNNVFSNLSDRLNEDIDTINTNKALYIAVSETDSTLILIKNEEEKKNNTTNISLCMYSSDHDDPLENSISGESSTLTCGKCHGAINSEDELGAHAESQLSYKCSDCNEIRCTEQSLRQHMDAVHKVFVCKDCGKSFKGIYKLQMHELKHVTKNECPKCGKSYNTKGFFLKHVKLCLEDRLDPHPMRSNIEKTYFCDKCGKGYSTPGGLRVHNRFVHGNAKPHVCEYCNKQFTAPSYLKVHMVKHTGEKNFKCDLCSRLFVSKEALLYHTRRHTGDKPYSCTMCDERFVNASARAEHIKFKHVGPTLMCEICSRKFFTPNFLRQHIKKHHDPSNKLYAGRSLIPPNVPAVENMRVRFID